MKTLVTGGAGFIGSHVAKGLIEAGHEVIVLDDLSGGFENNVPKESKFIKGSILDQDLLKNLFESENFDYVYHLAAYAAEGLSHFIKHFNYQNNLIGSINLINLSILHKIKCFVFTSSIAAYGNIPSPMKESDRPDPEDPYGVAKLAVEMELKTSMHQFGLNYVAFRPHNVYGAHQNLGDRYRNVIGIFMNQLMAGKSLSVFGDGLQTRAFSYISDIVGPMVECIQKKESYGEVYNIGADKTYTILELAQEVQKAFGITAEIKHLDARNEVVHANADHSKIQQHFGNLTQTTLAEGIESMSEWAKAQGPMEPSRFGNIEISEGLPPFWLEN
jgi:UDP-glucose 4-epimerase